MSSSSSPCAACKFLRRKCTQECVFAPYFPPDNPQKFQNVHKVFGASNVAKLLNELNPSQREDAVNSLAYEAEARLRDPVYGCVGLISILQHRLKQMQHDLTNAKKELATYIGPQALLPILQPPVFLQQQQQHVGGNPSSMMQQNVMPMMGIPTAASVSHGGQLVIREPQQQQQIFEAQQQLAAVVAAREQQDLLRGYEQQQQQQQQQGQQQEIVSPMSPSLALDNFDNPYQIQTQQLDHPRHQSSHGSHPLQAQLLIQPQQQNQQPQGSESEEGRSSGPC
ncbi:LOB domain-containing protein 6 [Hibiscus syriacus]|uniref:LOB domain-containing protein 6 n=1 Tax=Hibiscus syriacus TaxID=106335 RepID=A0A6A3ABX7_HIBSY|nr:LOB domain-containing protein 6 [Hibiscus syriacus]